MAPESFPGEAAQREWANWERAKKWVEQATYDHAPTGAVLEANDAVRRLATRYTATFLRETGGTLPQGSHELEDVQLVVNFPILTAIEAPAGAPRDAARL